VQEISLDDVALVNTLRVEPDLGSPARGGLPATIAFRVNLTVVVRNGWRFRAKSPPTQGSRAASAMHAQGDQQPDQGSSTKHYDALAASTVKGRA
jgi:hypothetical protein